MTQDAEETNPSARLLAAVLGEIGTINEFGETICSSETLPAAASGGDSGPSGVGFPESIGRYRLRKILGRGAFGTVFLGFDDQLERQVAVKVSSVVSGRKNVEESFRNEARQLAQLRHPNIVTVHDAGIDRGYCYVVSDFLEGMDLNHWLGEQRPSWLESVRVVACLASALAEAHRQGIVHRDVKPANVLMVERTEGWTPVLVDFGIALSETTAGAAGSRRGEVAGTPNYMSPEQARGAGHRIDGRTDIYALGVILYRMVSGKLPFTASTVADVLTQVIEDEPRPLRQFVSGIPRELDRICLMAMEKRISERYTTAGDFSEDLLALHRETAEAESRSAPRPAQGETESSKTGAGDVMRILIAEDNEISRMVLQENLERWGHTVSVAEDGQQAWELFQKQSYSIVITDWVMPRMDGLQLVQRIRTSAEGEHVYIIMLTAKAEKHEIVTGMGAGADDFLTKPFHPDELHVRLRARWRIIRMTRKLAETNQRLRRDLDAAGRIRSMFFPTSVPVVPGYKFVWDYRGCDRLGGDMLNIFLLDEGHVGIYILDVSGHGIPASLLATALSQALAPVADANSLLFDESPSDTDGLRIVPPEVVARRLNEKFTEPEQTGQFFTLLYGILDLPARTFCYTSAAHPPVIHQHADADQEVLDAFGIPIGIALDGSDYHSKTIHLEPGDRLVIYSSGLSNATNPAGELFGLQRLRQIVDKSASDPLQKMLDDVMQSMGAWRENVAQNDDVSLVAFEVE